MAGAVWARDSKANAPRNRLSTGALELDVERLGLRHNRQVAPAADRLEVLPVGIGPDTPLLAHLKLAVPLLQTCTACSLPHLPSRSSFCVRGLKRPRMTGCETAVENRTRLFTAPVVEVLISGDAGLLGGPEEDVV